MYTENSESKNNTLPAKVNMKTKEITVFLTDTFIEKLHLIGLRKELYSDKKTYTAIGIIYKKN